MPSNSHPAVSSATLPIALAQLGLAATFPNLAIYQRGSVTGGLFGLGRGSVPVPVSLNWPALAIDYRLRDAVASGNPVLQDWSPGAYAVPSGSSTVQLQAVPARLGWYFIDLRPNGDNSQIVLGTAKVGMGDVVSMSGQSLAVNGFAAVFGDTTTSCASLGLAANPNTAVFAAWGLNNAVPPYVNNNPAWAVPGDGTVYNSAFAVEYLNRVSAATGVNAGLIGFAVGASAMSVWEPGQPYNTELLAIIAAAGGRFGEFLWIQGHGDSILGTSSATWQANLTAIVNGLKSAFPSAAFTTVVSTIGSLIATSQGTPAAINTIRAAGKAWCVANAGLYIDNLDAALYTDNIHPSQAGKITMARHFYRAANRLITATGEGDAGPQLTAAVFSPGNTVIRLTVGENAGTALAAIGTPTNQFTAFPSGTTSGALTIASAVIVSATEIDLTLSAAATGNVDVYMRYPVDASSAVVSSGIYDNAVDADGLTPGRQLGLNVNPLTASMATATVNMAMTSAAYDTSAQKFGTGALSGGYGVVPASDVQALPFTFEAWVKHAANTSTNYVVPFGQKASASAGWYVIIGYNAASGYNPSAIALSYPGGATVNGTAVIADGNWHHVALVATSSGTTIYVDGASAINAGVLPVQSSIGIGVGGLQDGSYPWGGEIDEVALFNYARYTASFTPPSAPYTGSETGIKGLWHLDSSGNGAV